MDAETEKLIRTVVLDRGFRIRLEGFGGSVSVFVTDPNDPREGCGALRGEGGGSDRTIEQAIVDACTSARDDAYPQSRGCGRAVAQIDRAQGRWTWCVLGVGHDGDCMDSDGNTRPD